MEDRQPAEQQAERIIATMRVEWAGLYLPPYEQRAAPASLVCERGHGTQVSRVVPRTPSVAASEPGGGGAQI